MTDESETERRLAERYARLRAVIDETLAAQGMRACGDRSCVFGPPGGQCTNGGCRCIKEIRSPAQRAMFRRLASAIMWLSGEVAGRRERDRIAMGGR